MNDAQIESHLVQIERAIALIGDLRTDLAETLEDSFDGEPNFNFTWLFHAWSFTEDTMILYSPTHKNLYKVDLVLTRGNYVFMRGRMPDPTGTQAPVFVAVLRLDRKQG